MPPNSAVEQGAKVGRTRAAEDHTGHEQLKGRGAGTEPAQGAAQHLHPRLDDAKQRMENGGCEAEDSNAWHAGHGEVTKRPVPRVPLPPRRGEVRRLP